MIGPSRRLRALPTKRVLLAHVSAMLVLLVIGSSALLFSYDQVHGTAGQMRTDMALAVQEVAAGQKALLTAQEAARKTAREGLTDKVGAGEEYRIQLSAADQSLSRVAERQLPGDTGRSRLAQVNGLLTVYADTVGQATGKYATNDLMRMQKFTEAESILNRETTGIVPRLKTIQHEQVKQMRERVSFGFVQTAGWVVAEVSLLMLVIAMVSAWRSLWLRTGRRVNGWLLLAIPMTVALAVVPAYITHRTQTGLDRAGDSLAAMQNAAIDLDIAEQAEKTRKALEAVGPDHWWILAGCVVIALLLLVGLGLLRLYVDYWRAAP